MFSPTSLNFALGMLQGGAEGKTEEALADYLGTDDLLQNVWKLPTIFPFLPNH